MSVDKAIPILVVDNHETARGILRKQLRTLGFDNISEAGDAPEALGKLAHDDYGLVIAGGLELHRQIRAHPRGEKMPFLLVSSDDVAAVKKAGVDHYLAKPFDARMLKTKLENAMGEL